jgi:hypothetical protein
MPPGIYSLNIMNTLASLTSAQLKRAAAIKDQISALEQELANILHLSAKPALSGKKYKMSAAGRAKIAAAQRARWAKTAAARDLKKASQDNKKKRLQKPRRKMGAAVRAKMAAAAKARWAKVKAAGKNSL